jgi:hypothetical protein
MNISSDKIIPETIKKQNGSKHLTQINIKKRKITRTKIIYSAINNYFCKCYFSSKKVSSTLIKI